MPLPPAISTSLHKTARGGRREVRRSKNLVDDTVASTAAPLLCDSDVAATPRLCENKVAAAPLVCDGEVALADGCRGSSWQDCGYASEVVDIAVARAYGYLRVVDVHRASLACKAWGELGQGLSLEVTPRVMDSLLTFCLLDVLSDFPSERLPFPLTAVYGMMCALAKKAVRDDDITDRMVEFVAKQLGLGADARRQAQHMHGCLDVQKSSFKKMEKLWLHFHSSGLLRASQQRWFKSMKNGKNTRTCCEWLLTFVHRENPMFEVFRAAPE